MWVATMTYTGKKNMRKAEARLQYSADIARKQPVKLHFREVANDVLSR